MKGRDSIANIRSKRKNVPSAKENNKTIHADNKLAEYTMSHLWYIFTELCLFVTTRNKRSYMSAHVSLILTNELGKSDKMIGLPSILSLFRNEFTKLNLQEHKC